MSSSVSVEHETDPVSVNIQTGIRWDGLPANARFSAIKGQIKGGGASNPHATTNSIARRYLIGKLTKREAIKAVLKIPDGRKQRAVSLRIKNLLRMAPYVAGTPKLLPPPSRRQGPAGLVELKVTAKVLLEDHEDCYIGFWSNEASIDYDHARLYAQMMREAFQASEEKNTSFIVYDLKHRKKFIFDVRDLDGDDSDLKGFFNRIESDIKRARLH